MRKRTGLVLSDFTNRRTSFSSFSIASGSRRILRILLLRQSDDLSKKRLNVLVSPQPVCLWLEVPVNDIAFLVLETPRRNDDGIALADPGTFLDLSLDPAHAYNAVNALDTDMVCPQHCQGNGELFIVPFLWQTNTGYGGTVRIYRIRVCCCFIVFLVKTHSTNYVWYTDGC